MLGSALRERVPTWLPTVAFKVCNSTPDASTSTVWLSVPTFMVTLLVVVSPTAITSFGTLTFANPVFMKAASYVPGGTLTNVYRPAVLVVVVRTAFVAVSVRVTVTSGTTAPLWSVTKPTTVPCEPVCPQTDKAAQHNSSVEITAKETKDNKRRTSFISSPYVGVASFRGAGFHKCKSPRVFHATHNQTVV